MFARRLAPILLVALLVGALVPSAPAPAQEAVAIPTDAGQVYAGVGVVDATYHVGASAGQYASINAAEDEPAHNTDPYGQQVKNAPSYGIQSRLSGRALVIEGSDGTRVALLKNDLYIPQDILNQRIAAILVERDRLISLGAVQGEPTGINHTNLVSSVTHNHTSPYYTSPSWGVWAFQDVFDIRHFEFLAQRFARAIVEASSSMVPVRMGASTTYFDHTQRHSFGPATADDGTPAGYPKTDNDHSITVIRFDDVSGPEPKPLANYVTLGQHPEFLEGNNLISGDYVAALERMADTATGATTVFVQNNTGTSEPDRNCEAHPCSERSEYSHKEYAQAERGARVIADTIAAGFEAIAGEPRDWTRQALLPVSDQNVVPFSTDFAVAVNDKQFAPPYSHPYPSVSNCRTHEAAAGNPGVPIVGLPDCERITDGNAKEFFDQIPPPFNPGATIEMLRENGVPVPDNYSAPSYTGLQETFQVHLQAVRLGEVLITVCPCEQWSDQSLNIKSRADKEQGNIFVGFDWTADDRCTNNGDGTWTCPTQKIDGTGPTTVITDDQFQHIRAQVRKDASGWDAGIEGCTPDVANDGKCPLRAESEPTDYDLIKGNYTQSAFTPPEWMGDPFPAELSAENGYDLVVPVGMSNDYWGYIATYREYQRGDHYRKALTGLGPHSSDFFATRLITMGGALKGGPDYPLNALDNAYKVDGAHQEGRVQILGNIARALLPIYEAQSPIDGGDPAITDEQQTDITRFDAAQVSWIGGSNFFDDPRVVVQRLESGEWVEAGDMSGEVIVTVDFPEGEELPTWRAGQFEWKWTATFEVFDSDIDTGRGNQTPAGTYRFVIDGHRKEAPNSVVDYHLESETFDITRWEGITVPDIRLEPDGSVSFAVGPVNEKEFCTDTYADCAPTRAISVGPIDYPDTWQTAALPTEPPSGNKLFPRLQRSVVSGGGEDYLYCFPCTFRPWADTGEVGSATVTVERLDGTVEQIPATLEPDGRWYAAAGLFDGDIAYVDRAGITDTFGEINGQSSATVAGNRERPPTTTTTTTTVPPTTTTEPPTTTTAPPPPPPSGTTLEFTAMSDEAAQYSDEAFFEAILKDESGAAISGAEITFSLTGPPGTRTLTGTTDAGGVASAVATLTEMPGAEYQITARYAGAGTTYLGSADVAPFDVLKEESALDLDVSGKGANRRLRAALTDEDSPGSGIADATLRFFADGELMGAEATNANGVAVFNPPAKYQGGDRFYSVRFAGDDFFLNASASDRSGRGGKGSGGQSSPSNRGVYAI